MKTITTRTMAIAALLVAMTACHKSNVSPTAIGTSPTGSNNTGGTSNPVTITPCGDPVTVDLLAGQYMDAGSVTVYNTADSLYVTFTTDDNWKMGKTHLYVGDLASMPATPTGNPQVGNFPYSHTYNPYATYDRYAIALSSLPACFIVAAHAELYEIAPDGTILQTQTGWGQGSQFNTSGSWATYAEYCVQDCDPCVYSTESYTIYGGQTIEAGQLLVTNDETNLYITYQTSADWYIGKVHVYVGDAAGLPVNGANTPVPGQFPYQETYDPYTQNATITVPLAGLPACYVIAAHSELHQIIDGVETQQQTGWSFGDPFPNTTRWGWTSSYCTQVCDH